MNRKKAIGGSLGAFVIMIAANILPQGLLSLMDYFSVSHLITYPLAGICYLAFAYFLLRLFAKKVLHLSMEEMGISRFEIQGQWLCVAIILPLAVVGVLTLVPGEWHFSDATKIEQWEDIFYGIFFVGIAAGFVEEMVFRGFMLHLVQKGWNTIIAVLVPSFCFGIVHILGRQLSFASILQLVVAGTLVGVMFSMIMLASRSIWQSGLVHVLWNSVMMGGIVFVGTEINQDTMMTYVLNTHQAWLTGGDFGIESSVVAMIGYAIVCIIAYINLKRS